MGFAEFKEKYFMLNTYLCVFLYDWFGLESIEENTSIIVVLLTVSHSCSFLMMISEPLYVSCFDYFYALTLTDIIAIFVSSSTLISLYFCHKFDSTHWLKIVSIIHYLHFSGLVWIPVFAASWYSCMPTISITGSYNNKPAFILNYGPLTLNNCLAQPENCYNYYLLRHVDVLIVSVVFGVLHSLCIFILRKIDEYMMIQCHQELMNAWETCIADNRLRRGLSVSDSLCQYYSDSMNSPSRRRRMSTNSSSSDERIPLNPAGSSSLAYGHDTITVFKKRNKPTDGQQFEFEVHAPMDNMETSI